MRRLAANSTARPLDATFASRASLARALAGTTGLLFGLAIGLLANNGDAGAIGTGVLVFAGLCALVTVLFASPERGPLLAVLGLGFGFHIATAVILHAVLVAMDKSGFLTGDDAAYTRLAQDFALLLQGSPQPRHIPPLWNGDAYLFGAWVYTQTALFYLFGIHTLAPLIVNAGLAMVCAIVVGAMACRLFRRSAAVVTMCTVVFYPSLVLWSSLNLKEMLVLAPAALCLYALLRFEERPGWWTLTLALLVTVPLASTRIYVYLGLLLIIPIGVTISVLSRGSVRARWAPQWIVAAVLGSAALTVVGLTGVGLSPNVLISAENLRGATAANANTAFANPAPLTVAEGQTFVVPGQAVAGSSPATVFVKPGDRIVVGSARTPGDVTVRPGDLVVFGAPGTSPAPPEEQRPLHLNEDRTVTLAAGTTEDSLFRTARYLPVGVAHAFLAPFPWVIRRPLDLLTIPEMLGWYVLLILAGMSLWRRRALWRPLAPTALFIGGIASLLTLGEGNVGTLFRHRAMMIPFVILLASPELVRISSFVRGRVGA